MLTPGWYLLYTKPSHEKKTLDQLTEQNVEVYLPLHKKLSVWSDRKKFIDKPLFPGYLFIYLNNMDEYFKGLNAKGCLYYLRNGKTLSRVHENIVNNIKWATNQSGIYEITEKKFAAGDKLTINTGVFTGMECEVVVDNYQSKILVRIDLLNRSLLLTLSKSSMSKGALLAAEV